MKELVEMIARALVDAPEAVSVSEVPGDGATILELRVAPGDLGKVIGKQGRTVRSMRAIVAAAATKQGGHYALQVID